MYVRSADRGVFVWEKAQGVGEMTVSVFCEDQLSEFVYFVDMDMEFKEFLRGCGIVRGFCISWLYLVQH